MSASVAPPVEAASTVAPATVEVQQRASGDPSSVAVSIAELDGLRAIAFTSRVSFFGAWSALVTALDPSLGVICFFTLSGFLLTYLAVLEYRQTGGLDVRAFYVRRIFRIWPLHFVVVATVMLLVSPFGPLSIDERSFRWCIENLWPYLLFVNNWSMGFRGVGGHQDLSPPMLNISWSIAIEEQIYLLFPLVMLAVLGGSRRRRIVAASAIVGVAVAYRLYALLAWGAEQGGRLGVIYLATPSYFDVVLAGGIAGWICASRRLAGEGRLGGWRTHSLGASVLVGLVGVSLAWRYIYSVGSTYFDVVVYLLMGGRLRRRHVLDRREPDLAAHWRPALATASRPRHAPVRPVPLALHGPDDRPRLLDGFRPRGQGQIDILAVARS